MSNFFSFWYHHKGQNHTFTRNPHEWPLPVFLEVAVFISIRAVTALGYMKLLLILMLEYPEKLISKGYSQVGTVFDFEVFSAYLT